MKSYVQCCHKGETLSFDLLLIPLAPEKTAPNKYLECCVYSNERKQLNKLD